MEAKLVNKRFRQRATSERGFSLIELLVVMLILGILAAIAIPALLNQKNKANDSQAKTTARTMQTAMEACGTDNRGNYSNCNLTALRAVESAIPQTGNTISSTSTADTWSVSATSDNGNGRTFTISRADTGAVTRSCSVPSGSDRGSCQAGNTW